MKSALIEGATNNPKASDDLGGRRLPIKVEVHADREWCRSAWKPSAEELAVLNDGGYVELIVVGWQVPVALSVLGRDGAKELG